MRYKFVIPTLYIFSTLTLFAQGDKLGDVLQQVGKQQTLVPSIKEKKKTKKKSRFIFKDTYETNIVGSIDKNTHQKKSKNDENENKPRFKFKFTPGTGYSNIIVGHNTSPIGAGQGGGSSGGSYGGGSSGGGSSGGSYGGGSSGGSYGGGSSGGGSSGGGQGKGGRQ